MHRREMLRVLAAGAVLPTLTPELFAFFRQAQPGAGYSLRTLTPGQNDQIVAMIDLIIPATGTPGAKGVRVNEFMDVILTDWATAEERQRFLAGLADVDVRSNRLFGKNFVAASIEQQTDLLRALDDELSAERANSAETRHDPPIPDTQLQGSFFGVFKRMTLYGYYTSEVAFTEELKLEIIPGALHGCMPVAPKVSNT